MEKNEYNNGRIYGDTKAHAYVCAPGFGVSYTTGYGVEGVRLNAWKAAFPHSRRVVVSLTRDFPTMEAAHTFAINQGYLVPFSNNK